MAGNLLETKMTVIKLPRNICIPLKYEDPSPKQRVFYLGVVYTGPQRCQDVTELYLKRHGIKSGERMWSLITYDKYHIDDARRYSIELDKCVEDDVPDMLCQYFIGKHITFNDLRKFGWNGNVINNAKIIDFKKD